MNEFWEAVWFFLPAGVANMSPVLAARLPLIKNWRTPIDFGQAYNGKRLLGDNKTWRGLAFGGLAGAVTGLIQYRVLTYSAESTGFIVLVTGLMGLGALIGDAVESFFKRRAGVAPGEAWVPFDQIDYVIGGLVFVLPLIALSLADILRILLAYFVLHLFVGYLGYLIGLKSKPV